MWPRFSCDEVLSTSVDLPRLEESRVAGCYASGRKLRTARRTSAIGLFLSPGGLRGRGSSNAAERVVGKGKEPLTLRAVYAFALTARGTAAPDRPRPPGVRSVLAVPTCGQELQLSLHRQVGRGVCVYLQSAQPASESSLSPHVTVVEGQYAGFRFGLRKASGCQTLQPPVPPHAILQKGQLWFGLVGVRRFGLVGVEVDCQEVADATHGRKPAAQGGNYRLITEDASRVLLGCSIHVTSLDAAWRKLIGSPRFSPVVSAVSIAAPAFGQPTRR